MAEKQGRRLYDKVKGEPKAQTIEGYDFNKDPDAGQSSVPQTKTQKSGKASARPGGKPPADPCPMC